MNECALVIVGEDGAMAVVGTDAAVLQACKSSIRPLSVNHDVPFFCSILSCCES